MICGLLASGTHSGDWGITGRQSCPPPHLSCRSTNKYVAHVDRLPLIIRCIVKLCHTYAYTGRIVDVRTVCVDVGTPPSDLCPLAGPPFRHRDLTFASRQCKQQSSLVNFVIFKGISWNTLELLPISICLLKRRQSEEIGKPFAITVTCTNLYSIILLFVHCRSFKSDQCKNVLSLTKIINFGCSSIGCKWSIWSLWHSSSVHCIHFKPNLNVTKESQTNDDGMCTWDI